tara:strand:- start:632 stop:1207 length:576 start_codon:yes stop_codon:yes gene_type:complete
MTRYIKYFFYLIVILTSVIFFYSNYDKSEKTAEIENLKTETSAEEEISNLIENINYSSFDKEGNKYLIEAKSGRVNQNNFDKIKMKNVYAKITFINQEFIEIKSGFANYNRETSETLFYNEVLTSYLDHKIRSNQLELLFKDKLAKINENVIYSSDQGKVEADQVLLNLTSKIAKIFMNDSEEKVKISYLN